MNTQTKTLGGRLPLLEPQSLSGSQRQLYDRLNRTMIPWAESENFKGKTARGEFIGPFNPVLFSAGIAASFFDLQDAEQKHTTLSERVRQVVILSVGAVVKAPYELYAHSAVAAKAGFGQAAILALAKGGLPGELTKDETIAQQFTHQLVANHRVEPEVYSSAAAAFGSQGLVDMTFLIGIYHVVCSLLNAFDIPVP